MDRLRSFTFKQISIFVVLVILVFVVMHFNTRLETLNRREKAVQTVRAEATAGMQTQEALKTAIAYATSDDAARKFGYENEGGVPGDHPVNPIPVPGEMPEVYVDPTPEPAPQQNWQVWWDLFFGDF